MNYLGVKTTGYRHPFDPKQWSKHTWGFAAMIVLLALLFGMGIGGHEPEGTAPASSAAKP